MPLPSVYFTDRSRQVAFQKCPRLRFLGYELGGRGIQPATPDLDMELGKGIHFGIANLLGGMSLEDSVTYASEALTSALMNVYPFPILAAYLQLQEGLLRAFNAIWLPKISVKFRIVGQPEQEMSTWLDLVVPSSIVHMSRPDAVLQDKVTGEYGVWSIKTTSFSDDEALELEYRTDTQGLAEMWSAEQFYGGTAGEEPRVESDEAQRSNPASPHPKMSWSQMLFIHTGRKEQGEHGVIHESPVYQGWFKDDGLGSIQLAHSYWWKDAAGKKKGLGQAWKRFNVAEMYSGGIAQWIVDILAGKIQPEAGNPFESLFFTPPAHYRSPKSLEAWRLSTWYQEDRIRSAAAAYDDPSVSDETRDRILLQFFPQHHHSCCYMKRKCSMYQLCHGVAGEMEDPFVHGYKWREINHPQEKGEL